MRIEDVNVAVNETGILSCFEMVLTVFLLQKFH